MDQFLVNMAIVKVNWDRSCKDVLDNYEMDPSSWTVGSSL